VADALAASTGSTPSGATPTPKWLPLAALAAAALFVVGFNGTMKTLWEAWQNNENYSHGLLIPPIAAYLVWTKREELRALPLAPSWIGIAVLGLGVLLQLVGLRGDVSIFQGYALVLVIAGLIWGWGGSAWIRALWFPVAFLLFMVPVFPWFMNEVSFRLKVVATTGAVAIAHAMGVAVTQRGMDLFFPTGRLTIENACSGLNSLIALMALGALFAWFGTGSGWRRTLLFMASFPVAVIANVIRLGAIFVMAAVTSTERASGRFHDVGGFVLFGVALLLMAVVKRALRC